MAYRVVVTREGDQWLADVPELEGAHTYAATLRKLDQYVREVVVMAADLPDEAMPSLELEYEYRLGDELLDQRIERIRKNRAVIEQIQREVDADTENVLQLALTPAGLHLSQRDVADLIGLSHQRISQLVNEVPDELLREAIEDPDQLAMVREMGMRAVMVVPMTSARGRAP